MKRCIVVLGVHRSGTSLMTGLLNIFGGYLGGNLLGSKDDNVRGFFEHAGLLEVNEVVLEELDSSWRGYDNFPKNWYKTKEMLKYKEDIKEIIKNDFGKLDLFVIKEPRISVLLPLYLDVLKELKIKPLFIIMKRKEIEVAKSLKIRNDLSLMHSLKLYRRYYESIEEYTKDRNRIFVEFDDLIRNARGVIEKIGKFLKINFRKYDSVKNEIENFLDPKLKHHNLNYDDYLLFVENELEEKENVINDLIYNSLEKDSEIYDLKDLIEFREGEIKAKENEVKAKERELFNIKTSLTWRLNRRIDKLLNKIYPNYYGYFISKERGKGFQKKRKRKKILFVNHEESRTGAPKIVFDVAKEMKKYYETAMVSLKKGSMHEDFKNKFRVIYPKLSSVSIENEIIARRILIKEKPDLVYVNCIVSYHYAIEAKKLGIPVIFHIHELEEGFKSALYDVDSSEFNNWADVFIAVSNPVYNFLIDKKKCNSFKIKLINAFISSKEVIEKSKIKSYDSVINGIDKKNNEIVVMNIGSICKRKGTDVFIKTHKILKQRGYKNFKFIWIGGFEFKNQVLEDLNNKEEGCLFLGEKKNPFPYLNAADIFLLSSREDPFPLVCLESMTLGKPIIAFKDGGGMPKVIDNCCGLVVDELNPEKFADAIIKLIKDKKLMKKLSDNGIEEQKKYDSEKIISKIKFLINNIIENKNIEKSKKFHLNGESSNV